MIWICPRKGRCQDLIRTIQICDYIGSTDTTLKDAKITLIHIVVAIQIGILAIGIVLRIAIAGHAFLQVAEILQIHVKITIKIAGNGYWATVFVNYYTWRCVRTIVATVAHAVGCR